MGLEILKNLKNSESLNGIKKDIKENSKEYTISKGDSIYQIAKNNSMKVEDLILFNNMLGKEFKINKKNILIKAGDIVFVPKDIETFNDNLLKIKEIKKIFDTNDKITKSDLGMLKEEINFYPQRVQSIGLGKMLDGFVGAQKAEYDPRLSRIVDEKRETNVSCANLIRTLMAQSVNIGNLDVNEKAFFKKQNLDAWILPSELQKIKFDQKFRDLMSYFDKSKIGQVDPIGDQEGYDKKVLELASYLESSGIKGSLVPLYFKHSKFKGVVADYNAGKKEADKHYNTHQSIFAGNTEIEFKAFNVNDYHIPGKVIDFGSDTKKIMSEIDETTRSITNSKSDLFIIKQKLVDSVDLSNNEEMRKTDSKIIKGLSIDAGGNQEKISRLKNVLIKLDNRELIKSEAENILKKKISNADLDRFMELRKMYYHTYNSITAVNNIVSSNSKVDKVGKSLEANIEILKNIKEYNSLLDKVKNQENKLKNLNESLKIEKKINLVDYIANFIQDRLDYGPSALTQEARKKIIEGIFKYNSMIHVKVDGKEIDLAKEIENFKAGKSIVFVKSDSDISFSGPMMVDGEHQYYKGEDRKNKMNSRTRFLFEFIVPQTYLATELLEPGENSSLRKENFGKYSDKFSVIGVYDVRKGETVENVLKEKIVLYQKLNVNDPEFTNKLNYHYGLQIKALQVSGYLQDEAKLNPGAFKINREIPYFNPENIEEVFSSYVKNKKATIKETQEMLKDVKKYVSLDIFPGDVSHMIFNRLKSQLEGSSINKEVLENINNLNYFSQKKFIDQILKSVYDKNGKLKPGKKLIISFDLIEKNLNNIYDESYLSVPELKERDNYIIENTTKFKGNQDIMKNIIFNEIYGGEDKKTATKFIKKYTKDLGFTIGDLGDKLGETIDETKYMRYRRNTMKIPVGYYDRSDILYRSDRATSIGNFQIKFPYLKYGWNEYLNKETLNKALDSLNSYEFMSMFHKMTKEEKEIYKVDIEKVNELKVLINKENLTKEDFGEIYFKLKNIIRLTPYDNTGYVGEVISAHIMNQKINNHYEKMYGMLNKSGEDMDKIVYDKDKMTKINKLILLLNNQSENVSLYRLTENYILRILSGVFGKFETKDVYSKDLKGELLGKTEYGKGIFLEHLKSYVDKFYPYGLDKKQDDVKYKIAKFYNDLVEAKSHQEFMNIIYSFIKNPDIHKFLKENNLSSSIMIDDNELKSGAFQSSMFGYINKTEKK
ncbi:MAG: LysM peptidoglycan-binding domain-containing protein [Candidatus Gracilibacteria bacterium]|nr:LysM peptidoglycan-binding domain-containing protein [Candidatus Gracilibacteria bacterium]